MHSWPTTQNNNFNRLRYTASILKENDDKMKDNSTNGLFYTA